MPQSLRKQNIETYREDFERRLDCALNKYRLKRRFEIGEEVSTHEFLHTYLINDALKNKNCSLVDMIEDKLHKVTEIKKPYSTISELLILASEKTNCNVEDVCDKINQEW